MQFDLQLNKVPIDQVCVHNYTTACHYLYSCNRACTQACRHLTWQLQLHKWEAVSQRYCPQRRVCSYSVCFLTLNISHNKCCWKISFRWVSYQANVQKHVANCSGMQLKPCLLASVHSYTFDRRTVRWIAKHSKSQTTLWNWLSYNRLMSDISPRGFMGAELLTIGLCGWVDSSWEPQILSVKTDA